MSRILVTGSADGLGRLAADALLNQGHDVVVHARNSGRAETLRPLVDRGARLVVGDLAERDDVRELADGQAIDLAGMSFLIDHTPGHTEGSVTFRTPYPDHAEVSDVMFSGDLLFAGSIGRTDLPGGDHATMLQSLTTKVLPLADDIVVLPGHGEQTSIGRERATNPFLQDLITTP